jgi:hypothetical protein
MTTPRRAVRMAAAAVMLVVMLGACATPGPHAWRRSDVALEAVFLGALAADWSQSGKYVDGCREANPVIGSCGERMPLAGYILITAALHLVVTHVLPTGTWRTAWLGLTAGVELDTVLANHVLDGL